MNLKYSIKHNRDIKTSIYFRPTESSSLDDIKFLLENDDKIQVYTSESNEQENMYNSYKNVTDYIYRIITNSRFLCKGLNSQYVLNSFNEVDAVIIIGSSMDVLPNGNIFGFALINFHEEKNSLYVDVICSHKGIEGAGYYLIKTIESMAKKLFIKDIYLTSVDTAISFYQKYGFVKYDKLCEDNCVMIKSMNKKYGGNKRKTNKKSRKVRRTTIKKEN
jgi:N-acetylglutamate synthase-like GNAT family acetyltransferase